MHSYSSVFLDPDDRITADNTPGRLHVRVQVGKGVDLYFEPDQLPERIAQFEKVVLALRDAVDDVIADEKAQEVEDERPASEPDEPAWEMTLVRDLTVGRTIWRSETGRWEQITNLVVNPLDKPGTTMLGFGEHLVDGVMFASPNAAVRALAVVEPAEVHGESEAVAS